MKEELEKNIINILKEMGVENPKVVLEYPTQFTLGDLSTNIAMGYAKQLGKNPMDLAEEIKQKLEEALRQAQGDLSKQIKKIEVIKLGLINSFFASENYC